jgi:hypothetical protein
MRVYKGYDTGKIEELGAPDQSALPTLLSEAVSSIGKNDFCIGVNRSEKDFVEIRPVGKSQYMVWSDRLCKTGTFWQRLSQTRNIQKVVEGEERAIEALNTYMDESREAFEQAYT